MKKLFLFLMLTFSLLAYGSNNDDSKYLKGAVPQENGLIVFSKTFKVTGADKTQLHHNLYRFVKEELVERGIYDSSSRMLTEEKDPTSISAKVEEWLVFKKRFLSLDQTRLRYQIDVTTKGNTVTIQIKQISYLYEEEWDELQPTGRGGRIIRAEGWIDDESALNKKGTKLLPQSGKFRRKTIDRVQAIFAAAMDTIEGKMQSGEMTNNNETIKPKRQFVKE